jgi:hypothetical protein
LDAAPGVIRPPAAYEGAPGSGDGSGGVGPAPGRANPPASQGIALGPTPSSGPAFNPARPSSERAGPEPFKPWESTPLKQGDDEDWLR